MKNLNKYILIVVGMAVFIIGVYITLTHESTQTEQVKTPQIQSKNNTVANKSEINTNFIISSPLIKNENKLNALILDKIKAAENEFTKNILNTVNKDFNAKYVFDFNVSRSQVLQNDDFISLFIFIYTYTGGNHGETRIIPINYHRKMQKLFSANDLAEFLNSKNQNWLEILSQQARKILTEQLKTKDNSQDLELIEEGSTPKLNNFKNFMLAGDNIIFKFDEYQVGSHSIGMPEVNISLESLTGQKTTNPQSIVLLPEPKENELKNQISYTSSISLPLITNQNKLNALVLDKVKKASDDFAQNYLTTREELFDTAIKSVAASSFELNANIEMSEIYTSDKYASFVINIYEYTGGAHGINKLLPINYDIKTQKLLSLQEVVNSENPEWLEVLSQQAIAKIKHNLKDKADMPLIKLGASAKLENFKNFQIVGDDKIKIYFEPYQVGPYAIGTVIIELDLTDLRK